MNYQVPHKQILTVCISKVQMTRFVEILLVHSFIKNSDVATGIMLFSVIERRNLFKSNYKITTNYTQLEHG